MSDVFDRIRHAQGTTMEARDYHADFFHNFETARGVIWKVERAQYFAEPDVPSWVAFQEGDWERSMALIEDMRSGFATDYPPHAEFRRIRVVDEPLTPYMRWELPILKLRADLCERIRVVSAAAVHDLEAREPLP